MFETKTASWSKSKTAATLRISSLVDETPNCVMLHGGCDDVSNRNASPEQVPNDIKVIAEMCRGHGVNEIFLLSLIWGKNDYLNEKETRINFLLNLICKENVFVLIDNRNINIDHLWEDGLHLIEQEKATLARNFIHSLSSFIDNQWTIIFLQDVWMYTHKHTKIL